MEIIRKYEGIMLSLLGDEYSSGKIPVCHFTSDSVLYVNYFYTTNVALFTKNKSFYYI